MRNYIQKYFYHTRGERTGTLILLACILLSVALRYIKLTKPHIIDAQYSKELVLQSVYFLGKGALNESIDREIETSQNSFNPNDATREELVAAGLPPRIANILIHYREKGGFFKTKVDLKKIYGMTPALFAQLEPRILLPHQELKVNNFENYSAPEINSSEAFILKNFDPKYCNRRRIVKDGF